MLPDIHLSAANWIDVIVLVVVSVSVIVGLIRGLACECGRLVGFAIALAAIWLGYAPIRTHLFPDTSEIHTVLGIVATIVLAVSLGSVARWAFAKFLRLLVGQPADSILGACFSVLSVGILILAVFTVLRILPIEGVRTTVFEQSRSGRLAFPIVTHFISRQSAE